MRDPVPADWQEAESFLWFGDLYIAAAFQLVRSCDDRLMPPLLQALGTGIELVLKSYLVHCGASESDLKRVGHDLCRALDKALESGLGELNPSLKSDAVRETVQRLDRNYTVTKSGENKGRRRLVYPITGEDHDWGFGVAESALARELLRTVAKVLGYREGRLVAFEETPRRDSRMLDLLGSPLGGPLRGR